MPDIRKTAEGIVKGVFEGRAEPASGTGSLVPPTEGLITAKLIDAAHPDKGLVSPEAAKGEVFKAVGAALGPDRKTEAGVVGEAIITGVNGAVKAITGGRGK